MKKPLWPVDLIVLIAVIIFLAYCPSLNNGFTNWDDNVVLVENLLVHSLNFENLWKIFTSTVQKVYVPLTMLSFSIEYHFFKLNAFVYHFDNLILHILVSVLIFIFAQKIGLKRSAAFLGALLFGVHPMHVESVAWVTERKDVLYSFFYMLALIHYWEYLEGKKQKYPLTILWGILSLLAKPMALSLPLALWACDWLYGRKINKSVWIDKIWHFLYVIPITLVTYVNHVRVPTVTENNPFLVWIWTATFYIKKFFVPFDLVPLYQLPKPVSLQHDQHLMAMFIFFIIIISLIRLKTNKWFMFAFIFYFVSIFFILRWDDLKDENIVADRFMYLPSMGLCLWVGWWLSEQIKSAKKTKGLLIILAVCLYGILIFRTSQQQLVWKDGMSLWNYVIAKDNNSATGYLNRAAMYNRQKQYDLAITDLDRSIILSPTSTLAFNNRGMAYGMKGDYDRAFKDFSRALEMDPQYADAYANRGEFYRLKDKYDLALIDFEKALKLKPNFSIVYFNRSHTYLALKKYDLAFSDALKAKALEYPVEESYIVSLQKYVK